MTRLPDGLYQVTTNIFCAGFVVKNREVVLCAPILRKKFDYWSKSDNCKWVGR